MAPHNNLYFSVSSASLTLFFFVLPLAEFKLKVNAKWGFDVFFSGHGKIDVKIGQTQSCCSPFTSVICVLIYDCCMAWWLDYCNKNGLQHCVADSESCVAAEGPKAETESACGRARRHTFHFGFIKVSPWHPVHSASEYVQRVHIQPVRHTGQCILSTLRSDVMMWACVGWNLCLSLCVCFLRSAGEEWHVRFPLSWE